MHIVIGVLVAVAARQGVAVQSPQGNTSPPSGDTLGYWQQRVAYTITATLDERAQRVRARGTLRYVNNSPDTLRELYLHQYLNAFRPASKWSEVDDREGRERFQHLTEPYYGYERFTAPVRVNGLVVAVEYPGAPDSTVARFALPAPLLPRDSLVAVFEWEARPSTVPRRQGRRGRHWDLAQWYPKVAVYDRGGWEYNALQPAGELYGEFGTYDVTLVVAQDQVIGSTGVPVSGDPGWSRVIHAGVARSAAGAYDALPPAPAVDVGPGLKAVRFFARDVHHFAWSASPDYHYEGGVYVRALPNTHWKTWDTVSVHALYRAGDDTSWGRLHVVQRTIVALQWLEAIYGPYAYPQMTVLHRLDGGGTEFPMMQMNGSPSQGLILHEGGHVFTYGILANNEWRSGWMDEGLTSYQTDWAQLFTPQERVRADVVDEPVPVRGYRARGIRMELPRYESIALDQILTDLHGQAQSIGTVAHEFRDFGTYNDMIYDRAEMMYGQLRDVLGDSVFVEFLHDYYGRWALKHVDERAMCASAERVSGRDLGWFFDQWVHHTGVTDYALGKVTRTREASGIWVTEATVARRGYYRHLIAVGVRTASGWTLAKVGSAQAERQTVRISTSSEPLEVRLDPFHFSWDWDRRDDVERHFKFFSLNGARANFDWPFLDQQDREHNVFLWSPMAWYSELGGANVGVRTRASYLGWLEKADFGVVLATRDELGLDRRLQFWERIENPTFRRRPAIGWRMRFAQLDDILKFDIGRKGEVSSARGARMNDIALTYTDVVPSRTFALSGCFFDPGTGAAICPTPLSLVPEMWRDLRTLDLAVRGRFQRGRSTRSHSFVEPSGVVGVSGGSSTRNSWYTKLELAAGGVQVLSNDAQLAIRAYGAIASVPAQRALVLNAADPISTFENNWWRPSGAIFKRPGVNWLPLGGAALRGFRWDLPVSDLEGGNVDASRRIVSWASDSLSLRMHAFADAAYRDHHDLLSDAGVGLSVRGRLYDRRITIRIDSPFFVNRPELAIDRGRAGREQLAPRWAISFSDIW
jgi:hypothetical protein